MKINPINDYIKDTLETYCKSKNPDSTFEVSAKHIIHIDEDEFKELNKCKLEYNISVTQLRFSVIDVSGKKNLIIVGTQELVVENESFMPISINNVIFLSVVESTKLSIRESVSDSYIEEIVYPVDDVDNMGYDVDKIAELYEPFMVYEVPSEEISTESRIKSHIAKILLSNPKFLYLSFLSNTVDSYLEYYNSENYDDNIFNSSLAYCWRYCFLDIYRCIEPIFRHLPLTKVKREIGYKGSIDCLFEIINNCCGWRPQETSSMEILFSKDFLSEPLLKRFRSIKNIEDSPGENIGKSIYRLRNKIVHYQGKSSDIENLLTSGEWNTLVSCLIDALVELRKKFPLDS